MSGTSADGIDAVLSRVGGSPGKLKANLLEHVHVPMPPAWRQRILQAATEGTVAEACELNFGLGELFARAALRVLKKAGVRPDEVAAIGSHGQTIRHLPYAHSPSTLQIGEPAVIAERTGITTVADFRVADMAAGGQGAPLVAFADWTLFNHASRPRIIQNIGGIGNLTFIPAGAEIGQVLAFDTGPGNMVTDALVGEVTTGRQSMDFGGRLAARGRVSNELLAEALQHPFFQRTPPKTTGREEFGPGYVAWFLGQARRLKIGFEDVVATSTALTAETISRAYGSYVFPLVSQRERRRLQVVLGGGGAKNPTLRRMLAERLSGMELLTHADFGIDDSAKEALAFAILAYQTLRGRPGNVPAATGARRGVVLGKIVPGRNFRGLRLE